MEICRPDYVINVSVEDDTQTFALNGGGETVSFGDGYFGADEKEFNFIAI